MARHLFIHYSRDKVAQSLSYQEYMLGSEILVAPALDPGVRRLHVYLPAGIWPHL